ncbi:MAG: carboxypeptidase-like regulatory domain-containing protein [Bacteroidia bacterium]
MTDATGKYRFTRLHPGTYVITISKAGYVTQTKTITVSVNGTYENDFVMVPHL